MSDAEGGTVSLSYNGNSHVDSMVASHSTYGVLQQVAVNEIDEIGRPLDWTVDKRATSSASYNAASKQITMTGPEGTTRTTQYDDRGLVTSDSVPGFYSNQNIFDSEGRLTRAIRREGATQKDYGGYLSYSSLNHVQSISDARSMPLVQFDRRSDGVSKSHTRSPGNLSLTTQTPRSILGESLGEVRPSGTTTKFELDDKPPAIDGGPGQR